MKRILRSLIFLVLIIFGFWFFLKPTPLPPLTKQETKTEDNNPLKGMREISFKEQKFFFLEEKIENHNDLKLIPNFEEKNSSSELFKKNNCQFLINGGFYGEDDQPLGWFFTQGEMFNQEVKSSLLNGFFFLNSQQQIHINNNLPADSYVWGLQTGPILIFNGQPLELRMTKDERARRMVAALNQNDEFYFLVVTGSDSLAGGPFLADLPLITQEVGKALGVDFKAAINLDGGTASAFINKEKTIKEYTWIGSFFCLKKAKMGG